MSGKRIAFITGSSRGIGFAIAKHFSNKGWDVITHSRSPNAPPFSSMHLEADLTIENHRIGLIKEIKKHYRELHLLVHNAGIFLPSLISEKETTQELRELLEVHVIAVQHLTSELLPIMPAKSNIVVISSIAALRPYLPGSAYSVAKAAERMLGLCLREELKDREIGVHIINPGPVLTDSWAGINLPPERFSSTQDLAQIVDLIVRLSPRTIPEEITLNPMQGPIE